MQKGALKGISDVIKAHTTEKSINELIAQGKKRVRVVSGQRVMEIIQAIVDDSIDREVGEITKRDRDNIVRDTRERFDRVLKMQTDLEQTVSDLRSQVRESDLERERLRADKRFLEQQMESARESAGEPENVTRVSRDIDRLREAVDEIHRRVSTADEAAIGRAVERLSTRDDQNAHRLVTELDDVRKRIDGVSRESARGREANLDALMERLTDGQRRSDADLAKRLEAEFNGVHERITELRDRVAATGAGDDALERLRNDLEGLEGRLRDVESSSTALAEQVSAAVSAEIGALREQLAKSMQGGDTAGAAALAHVERHLGERFAEESKGMRRALGVLAERVSAIDERTGNAVEAVAERVAERVVIDEGALTDAVARTASRVDARIDEITNAVAAADERRASEVKALRNDILAAAADHAGIDAALDALAERQDARLDAALGTLRTEWAGRHESLLGSLDAGMSQLAAKVAAVAERAAAVDESLPARLAEAVEAALAAAVGGVRQDVGALGDRLAEATPSTLAAVERSLGAVRDEMAAVRDELGSITTRAVASESGLREVVHEAVAGLRSEMESLAARQGDTHRVAAETAARQDEAIAALRAEIAAAAAAQSAATNARFEGALDAALDKITRAMESATARPIEINVEATDALLDKIFDAGDDEMTSNLGQLEVEERTGGGIAGSLGKLRALHAPRKNGKAD